MPSNTRLFFRILRRFFLLLGEELVECLLVHRFPFVQVDLQVFFELAEVLTGRNLSAFLKELSVVELAGLFSCFYRFFAGQKFEYAIGGLFDSYGSNRLRLCLYLGLRPQREVLGPLRSDCNQPVFAVDFRVIVLYGQGNDVPSFLLI